ncbi:hypothetical protein D3C72_1709150 [compost metagenome]
MQDAIGRAPHHQLRRNNGNLLSPQSQQRRYRQGNFHLRQRQTGSAIGLQQLNPSRCNGGHQAVVAIGLQRFDAHGHAQQLRQARFHLRAKVIDTRHNPPVQRRHGHCQEQCRNQQKPQGPLRQCGKGPEQSGRAHSQ